MENSFYYCFLACIFFFCSCEPQQPAVQEEPDAIILAENFRSESSISVPKEDEIWIGSFDNKRLVDVVFDAIYEGKVIAYDLLNNPISKAEIKALEHSIDTAYIENFETGEMEEAVIENQLDRNDIIKIFLREDWIFNEDAFSMKKDVISMTLTTAKFDNDGNMIGYQALFSVYFNGHEIPIPM